MFRATIILNVKKMPTEEMSLNELRDFFNYQDRYYVADYFSHIKSFLSYCGRNSLKYRLVTENNQDKLVLEFADKKGLDFFNMMAPQCKFSECIEV